MYVTIQNNPAQASPQSEIVQHAVENILDGTATGVVLVAQNDQVIWAGPAGRGVAAEGLTRDTAFDIASMTKTLTATAVLRLVQDGQIDLDTPLNRYLHNLPQTTADATVRLTLNMQAGWPAYLEGHDLTPKSAADVVDELATLTRDRPAGEGYGYSNVGFAALGVLIEAVTNMSYPQAMRSLVFDPAGMDRTAFFGPDALVPGPLARGFVNGGVTGAPDVWPITWAGLGSGQTVSTVDDLWKFHRAVTAGLILDPEHLSLRYAPGVDTDGRGPLRSPDRLQTSYGMGLYHWQDRAGRTIHFHGGGTDFGFHSMYYWRPQDDLVVIGLFNSEEEGFDRAALLEVIDAALSPP